MTNTRGWFAAELVLEAEHPDEPDFGGKLFERRVVLFAGRDETEAQRKASEYCQGSEHTYENEYGARVTWRCLRVLAVTPLYDDELKDGIEVYSELLDTEPGAATLNGPGRVIQILPLDGIPEVSPGDDLGSLIAAALGAAGIGLSEDDVLVVTQKIVSKAEGRVVELASVQPSARAVEWGERWGKDPRQVELVLRESAEIVRMADGGLIISRTRHGLVCANAGVDLSNTGRGGAERATLLPQDPDASARVIRERLGELAGARPAVIVSDSFGRPWRDGITDVAIGAAGIEVLADLRGKPDADGRELHATVVAVADELAAASELAAGKSSGRPVVLVRGYPYRRPTGEDRGGRPLIMDRARDLFP